MASNRIGTVVATLIGCLSWLPPALAAEAPLRLIETGPGQRTWMTEDQIQGISETVHARGHCGGFMDVTGDPAFQAVPVTTPVVFETRVPFMKNEVEPLMTEVSASNLNSTVKELSSFKNRYYRSSFGVQSAKWIKDQFQALAKGRTDIVIDEFKHSFVQPSIIVRIQGNGPLKNERVILGAHQDSIQGWGGQGETMVAPGADDDASGVATLFEAFRIIAQSGHRPDRTIEFMAYAGEEAGLLGSQDIARQYQTNKVPVVAMLQFDMTMYPGRASSMTLMQDFVHPGLSKFSAKLIDTYVKAPWSTGKCGYGCSDHASWNKAGYASAFPFETVMNDHNPDIHTSKDLLTQLNLDFGARFAKLAVAFAMEIGSEPDGLAF